MITAARVFSLANTAALLCWLVLIAFQRRRRVTDAAILTIVTLFALMYAGVVGARWMGSTGGFSSLASVAALFSDPWLLLGGWLHYLAFDLLVGRWQAQDASARGISPWLVTPCLVLTFMFGPAGWLAYRSLRALHRAPSR